MKKYTYYDNLIIQVFGCSVINSTISLQNNEGFTVTEEVVNPWTCINKACRLNFNPNDYRIDYILYAQNNYSEGSLNTSSIIICKLHCFVSLENC